MAKLDLAQIISEEVRDKSGKVVDSKGLGSLPPSIDLSDRVGMAGVTAAQVVLSEGGTMKDAVDAAIKARRSIQEAPPIKEELKASNPDNPELESLIRYVHSIARLHSGRFEDLTPIGMLEVAMLCPYPVVDYETWKAKISMVTKGE